MKKIWLIIVLIGGTLVSLFWVYTTDFVIGQKQDTNIELRENMKRRVRKLQNNKDSFALTWSTSASNLEYSLDKDYIITTEKEGYDLYQRIWYADYRSSGLSWFTDVMIRTYNYPWTSIFEVPGETDLFGNILYIEKGYKIEEKTRGFNEGDIIFSETEMIIYDQEDNKAYHNTKIDLLITD